MALKNRQDEIINILKKEGYVTVKYLVEKLHYSSATVNRDLNALEEQGIITRSYGGAELTKSRYVPVFFREHKMRAEKRRIGKAAAALIKDGETIFIDGSTTAQYMEQYLINKKGLTVITNNIILTANLSDYGIKAVCLGGQVVEAPSMLYGRETVENASGYVYDKAFFSTVSATEEGIIASGLYEPLLKAVMERAKEIIYLIDHEKINKHFNDVLCDFGKVNKVISDRSFSEKVKEKYRATEFITAEKE